MWHVLGVRSRQFMVGRCAHVKPGDRFLFIQMCYIEEIISQKSYFPHAVR